MLEAPVLKPMLADKLMAVPTTPAFIYHADELRRTASRIRDVASISGSKLLYSVKANNLPGVLGTLRPFVDGFGVSSLSEARAVKEALGDSGTIHLYSVAIPLADADELANLCDYVTVNSLGQLRRWEPKFRGRAHVGLRVNPGRSFLDDRRYDPCRPHSKLGVPLDDLADSANEIFPLIEGLHVHSNCDSTDFQHLLDTVDVLESRLGPILDQIEWINLGGGYLFEDGMDFASLHEAVKILQQKFGLEVIIEPGATFVRESGYIIASVLDLFDSDGKTIAVLDTTVNHMPEVFEYQFKPDVVCDSETGRSEYILAGLSCLAGDVFGEYRFDEPLDIGSHIVFKNAGAYTVVKAHTFNGIPLPSLYELQAGGTFVEMPWTQDVTS